MEKTLIMFRRDLSPLLKLSFIVELQMMIVFSALGYLHYQYITFFDILTYSLYTFAYLFCASLCFRKTKGTLFELCRRYWYYLFIIFLMCFIQSLFTPVNVKVFLYLYKSLKLPAEITLLGNNSFKDLTSSVLLIFPFALLVSCARKTNYITGLILSVKNFTSLFAVFLIYITGSNILFRIYEFLLTSFAKGIDYTLLYLIGLFIKIILTLILPAYYILNKAADPAENISAGTPARNGKIIIPR